MLFMIAPQFSIRRLLAFTVVCSVFFYFVSMAVRGRLWAVHFALIGIAVVVSLVVYALFFFIAWLFSLALKDLYSQPKSHSPFAQHRPAPQIVPPDKAP